jgi:hypothetical protein
MFPLPPEEDPDTPRTYRSDAEVYSKKDKKKKQPTGGAEETEYGGIFEKTEAKDMLRHMFLYLKRAVVSMCVVHLCFLARNLSIINLIIYIFLHTLYKSYI